MTKFIYLSDSHCCDDPQRYQQQQAYTERLPEITAALRGYIDDMKDIDFVLHGSDLIDASSENNIRVGAELFDLTIPVYLCLGNHDLTVPDALGQWLRIAPQFFLGGKAEYSIPTKDCIIHVAPNHWGVNPTTGNVCRKCILMSSRWIF